MSNSFKDSCVALVIGIGSGLLLSTGVQKLLNNTTKNTATQDQTTTLYVHKDS